MKKTILFLLTVALTGCISVQSSSQHPVNKDALSVDSSKAKLMVFSGSDWCKPCIMLKQSILQSNEFQTYETSELDLIEVDFPYKKKNLLPKTKALHNEKLAEKYNPDGVFPKVILFDADDNIVGLIKYQKNMSPENFIDQISTLLSKR